MIFQKASPRVALENSEDIMDGVAEAPGFADDEVETVVGPSVHVEGDFASQGNIVVKGSVSGSVTTSRHLTVEQGAKITANVKAGSARIAGEVKGNMKVKESLELTSTAKILGDIDVKILTVEPGAALYGKLTMPGVDVGEVKAMRAGRNAAKKMEEVSGAAIV